jgi:5-methylcytosine-specific restriction protein A
MATPLATLDEVLAEVHALWPAESTDDLSRDEVARINELLGQSRRLLDAAQARIATAVARHSRPELGPAGLAKTQGFRNPVTLIATTMGTTTGEASRMLQVGEATEPRMTFCGETAPPAHPFVATGVEAGTIGLPAASAIIRMLDKIPVSAGTDRIAQAEELLVQGAAGLSIDQLSRLLLRTQALLDPDGVAEREAELRSETKVHMREDRDGRLHLNGVFDPGTGAPIKVAIEVYVTAQLRARQDAAPDAPRQSIPQLQAEALSRVCDHLLGCEQRDTPIAGATVVVRIDLKGLENGTGHATIDGLSAPISAGTARRIAASADIIPAVLGCDSEILDWGRKKRLFTPEQKLMLTERDGGCAMCGAPPSHTKAHHRRWWGRDAGPTDLANGALLCESCHHHIHDNGWEIFVDGAGVHATVWFVPPASVDPARTPRRGANRSNVLVAALA